MEQITIKNFNGMNLKEGLWDQGFSGYSQSMDFYGLGDDQTNHSYTGVLQGGMALSSMKQAASTNNITSLISDFAWFPGANGGAGQVYALDTSASSRIYKWAAGTPNWILDHSVSATSGTGIGNNMALYTGNIYYTTGTHLSQLTAVGVYDDSFQIGLTLANPQPMKVFAGSLFIGHGQFVAKYDGTTWNLQKLVLPSDFVIRSMEVDRDGLYISADLNGASGFSRIFTWDGTSPTYNDSRVLPNENFAPSLIAAAGVLWLVGNRGGNRSNAPSTALTPIYVIQPGQSPDLLFELPLRRETSPGNTAPLAGVAAYQGGILVGSSEGPTPTSSFPEGPVSGAWYIGKDLTTGLFHASVYMGAGAGVTVGGIFSSGRTQTGTLGPAVYVATDNQGTFGVYQAASPSVSDSVLGIPTWISLPIDAGSTKNKAWTTLKVNFNALTTNQKIKFEIRFDDSTFGAATNVVKTFTYSASQSITSPYSDRYLMIPIGRVSRTVGIKISLPFVATSTATTRIHSVTLYYEPFES